MSAVAKVARALGIESKEERDRRVSELGHSASRVVEAASRRLGQLQSQPATLAQVLGVEPINVGIDFAELDRLTDAVEQVLKTTGRQGLGFAMEGSWHTLDTWLVQLRDVRMAVEPYRKGGVGKG